MDFLLEITLIGCIICLGLTIYSLKKHKLNADFLNKNNTFLKDQLTQQEESSKSREFQFNQTIQNLQSSFDKEQNLIQERKLELDAKEKHLTNQLLDLEQKLTEETETRKKVVSQKKSGEVRLGYIAETLAPFLDQFEFDPEECSFLGKPIDYISFGSEEITLIEVKSGNSQLNTKQRFIRDQIKDKKVAWKEIRIK